MNDKNQGLHPRLTAGECRVCSLDPHCLQWNVGPVERMRLESIIEKPQPFPDGHTIFRAGDELRDLYAVRYGVFKLYAGDGRVVDFSLPGELVGLDAVQRHQHIYSGAAHGESAACALPYEGLIALMADVATLRHQFMRLVNRNLVARPVQVLQPAERRVAGFLLDVSRRLEGGGGPVLRFDLPLGLEDSASYLGMAPQGLVTLFIEFSARGLVRVDGRQVQLLDVPGLRQMAGPMAS